MTESARPELSYDVVIVTKNRPDLIPFSLGSIFEQKPPPRQLILVDASDDHQQVVEAAESCREASDTTTELKIIKFRPWQAAQRNEGLLHVTAPIVFIPDDDSILLPHAAEEVLRVYERDTEQCIGGVGIKETRTPPPSVRSRDAQQARKAGLFDRLIYRFSHRKAKLITRLAENPMRVACRLLLEKHTPPAWLEEADATQVPYIHGFRMTFRTEVVREYGFNEDFARGRGFDDIDIALSVLPTHQLVDANRAMVYHHRMGGKRDNALEAGLTQLLNPCYITCRHTSPNSPARRAIRPFARRLMLDYGLRVMSSYDRQRLRAIRRAMKWLPYLLDAPPEELTARYQHAFEQCRGGAGGYQASPSESRPS